MVRQGRKKVKAELASRADTAMQQLQMFGHGCNTCSAEEELSNSSQRHLVRPTCQELLDYLDLLLSYHEVSWTVPLGKACYPRLR